MRIDVDIVGDNRVASRLRNMLGTSSGSWMPAPQIAGMAILDMVARIFTSEGDGAWPRSRMSELTGRQTLQDTGALFESIMSMGRRARKSAYYLRPFRSWRRVDSETRRRGARGDRHLPSQVHARRSGRQFAIRRGSERAGSVLLRALRDDHSCTAISVLPSGGSNLHRRELAELGRTQLRLRHRTMIWAGRRTIRECLRGSPPYRVGDTPRPSALSTQVMVAKQED